MDRHPCARAASAAAFSFALILAASTTRGDGPFTFTKVVDQNASLPGSATPPPFFFEFSPAISDGNVAFSTSRNFSNHGLFVTDGSAVGRIVDRSTILPNGSGAFQFLNGFAQDGKASVFTAYGSSFQGVFRSENGVLTTIADGNTIVPATDNGADAQIGGALVPSANAGVIAFSAGTSRGQGIYTYANGSLHTIADHFTPVPGVAGAVFSAVGSPVVRNGKVAFGVPQFSTPSNAIVAGQGIYRASALGGGAVQKIVDTGTPKPGGGTFGDLIHSSGDQLDLMDFDGQNVVFDVIHNKAIYTDVGGIRAVADENTLIPGTSVPFGLFGPAAIDHGRIVFSGAPATFDPNVPRAIYSWDAGQLTRVLALGDVVDGKTVSNFTFDGNSLDGDDLAVNLAFNDGPSGIYQTAVPEPGAAGLVTIAAGVLSLRRVRARGCRRAG
jgi:hypothetical protein